MERIILANCVVLCAIILSCRVVLSLPNYELEVSEKGAEKSPQRKDAYLWFGPRLGRKKRNLAVSEEFYRNNDPDADQIASLLEAVKETPWAIVAVKEGKRRTVNFTPRLGRESGEDYANGVKGDRYWFQDGEISGELLSHRSSPPSGRPLAPFIPRLGRENDKNNLS